LPTRRRAPAHQPEASTTIRTNTPTTDPHRDAYRNGACDRHAHPTRTAIVRTGTPTDREPDVHRHPDAHADPQPNAHQYADLHPNAWRNGNTAPQPQRGHRSNVHADSDQNTDDCADCPPVFRPFGVRRGISSTTRHLALGTRAVRNAQRPTPAAIWLARDRSGIYPGHERA
jgi:hypothetical protein